MKAASRLGEADIIALAGRLFGPGPAEVLQAIGDDAAVVASDGQTWLLTSDLLVEGIHFERSWLEPAALGRRLLSVNLSDVAAMGGRSRFGLLSFCLPALIEPEWVEAFLGGLARAAERRQVAVLGGDTTGSSGPIVANLALWGQALEGRVVYRRGGRPGDRLLVSRPLAAAAAGLAGLEAGVEVPLKLKTALCEPEPEIDLGPFLAATGLVRAMIDLSDGLGPDAAKLARASGAAAVITAAAVPVDPEAAALAGELGRSAFKWAISGGEDYALLFACPPEAEAELKARVAEAFGRRLHAVGRLEAGEGLHFEEEGGLRPAEASEVVGFDHLADRT